MSKYSENLPPSLRGAIEWMIDDIKPGTTVLDFGCATGYFGKYLKDNKGCTVYGVEISDDIKEAKKVLDGVYSFDLDGDWPAKIYERQYDYLFYGDVIEHLKDPGKVLEKSKALLKKNGLVFISTPNVAHISVRLELISGNFEYEPMGILDNTHLKYFTKKSLTDLISSAGYKLKSIDFTTNDYPDSVIKTILARNGLMPNKKFWEMVDKPEARAFQYKLIIQPKGNNAPNRSAKTKVITPEKPERIRNAAMDDLNQKVENLQQHAKEQVKIIEHYIDTNKALQSKVDIVESSRTYKTIHKVRKNLARLKSKAQP